MTPITRESGKRMSNGSAKTEKDGKKEKKSTKEARELNVCKSILTEMEKSNDAWPFLLPVNTKQFPTYKKIIKKAMDMQTIRTKLDNGRYVFQ